MMHLFVRALNYSGMSWPGCVAAQFPNDGSSEGEVGTDCRADTQPAAERGKLGNGCCSTSHCHIAVVSSGVVWVLC